MKRLWCVVLLSFFLCLAAVAEETIPATGTETLPVTSDAATQPVASKKALPPAKTEAATPGTVEETPAPSGLETSPAVVAPDASPAPPVDAAGEDVVPVVKDDDDDIYVQHTRTYDLPQNENKPDLPQRIFVLSLKVYGGWPADDMVLHTNAGIGVMRAGLNSTMANHDADIEIACHRRAGDDCNPEAIIIYGATSFARLGNEPPRKIRDILPRLRQKPDPPRPFEIEEGRLPRAGARTSERRNAASDIRVCYESFIDTRGSLFLIRLTFPPGTRKRYSGFQLGTSVGYNIFPDDVMEDPRMPDSVVLRLQLPYEKWEFFPEPGAPAYVPPDAARLGRKGVFINEAYVFQGKKKINILQQLVQDSFTPLSIRTTAGPLPTVPPEALYGTID